MFFISIQRPCNPLWCAEFNAIIKNIHSAINWGNFLNKKQNFSTSSVPRSFSGLVRRQKEFTPWRCSSVTMSTTPGRLRASDRSIDLDKNTHRGISEQPCSPKTLENMLSWKISYKSGKVCLGTAPTVLCQTIGKMKLLYAGTNCNNSTFQPHFTSKLLWIASANSSVHALQPLLFTNGT